MQLTPEETQLIGAWLYTNAKLQADANAQRIEWLLDHQLRYVARDESGWLRLYQDPADGRYWELSFPQGHLQGGGPPALTRLEREEAIRRYGLVC
ncbi:Imm27 family immunity protein [Hymenobacter jejuensis]|uniref:Immunity protein 27 of polymorphic toxin system n=1 Tax=Hymenobacter jejuensis TaxID=2502781 RepID=A0A5B8A7D1_9BACT|nr:Imm27 family immunity protein [Hymenobacter jejuensis]QDA62392.1 hypothetical protein FHG12_20855 [Hymenobacter jejuensis]